MDYIIKHKDTLKHYFSLPNEGLCVRTKRLNIWQNRKTVYQDCKNVFSVFCDAKDIIHAICINSQNEIIYLVFKNSEWKHYRVTRLNEKMKVLDIKIAKTRIGLNLIYSVQFEEKIILIHCVLGDNAMPNNLDTLASPDFFIFKERVYYTNNEGVLGYRSFSDGRPDRFNKLVKDALMPHLLEVENTDMLVYKKDGQIYFQNRPVHRESNAQNPTLAENDSQLLLMWQNGDFVRYIMSSDLGKSWSGVVQFVSPGRKSNIYHAIHNEEIFRYFGNQGEHELNIFGKTDIFKIPSKLPLQKNPDSFVAASGQITRLKILLEMQKQEIKELKKEINHLSSFIKSISGEIDENPIKNNPKNSDQLSPDSANSAKIQ